MIPNPSTVPPPLRGGRHHRRRHTRCASDRLWKAGGRRHPERAWHVTVRQWLRCGQHRLYGRAPRPRSTASSSTWSSRAVCYEPRRGRRSSSGPTSAHVVRVPAGWLYGPTDRSGMVNLLPTGWFVHDVWCRDRARSGLRRAGGPSRVLGRASYRMVQKGDKPVISATLTATGITDAGEQPGTHGHLSGDVGRFDGGAGAAVRPGLLRLPSGCSTTYGIRRKATLFHSGLEMCGPSTVRPADGALRAFPARLIPPRSMAASFGSTACRTSPSPPRHAYRAA